MLQDGMELTAFTPLQELSNSLAKVLVKKHVGQQELLDIPSRKTLMPSFTDDGLLEIVGQKEVWLAHKERIRLDQVRGIRFEFIEGAAEFVNMSFDGAPWKKIPLASIIDIEPSFHSQVNILANGDCPAKRSNHVSSQPSTSGRNEDNNAPCASRSDDKNAPSASSSDDNAPGASITDDGNAKDKSTLVKYLNSVLANYIM